jgi:hypothetical protein
VAIRPQKALWIVVEFCGLLDEQKGKTRWEDHMIPERTRWSGFFTENRKAG